MKLKNILFLLIANIIIIAVVLTLVLLFVDLSNPIRVATFILMLLTLLIPSVMVIFFKEFGSPMSILTFSLFIINLITTVILFSIDILDIKPLIISETIIFGLYLSLMFVALAEKNYNKLE